MGTKRQRTASIILLGIALAAAAALVSLQKVGSWLAVADPLPERIDVVYTFAGENTRFAYSRDLMERYRNAHWVLSDYFHHYSRILARGKYDMSRISVVDTCHNTISEVRGFVDWIHETRAAAAPDAAPDTATGLGAVRKKEKLHVALISNPFHMRRIKNMVESVPHGDTLVFFYCPVPLERYHWTARDVRRWWRSETMRNWISSEIVKLIAFRLFSYKG